LKDNLLYTGSHDTQIKMWDLSENNAYSCLKTVTGHSYTIWSLVIVNNKLYSGSSDNTIRVWDAATLDLLKVIDIKAKVYAMASKDKYIYFSGADKTIQILDTTTDTQIICDATHNECVWTLTVKDNYLITGSDDKTVKIWELIQGIPRIVSTITESSKVLSLTVTQKYIVIGTTNAAIKVWNRHTSQLEKTLTGHSWEVWQVTTLNGHFISGSYDHTIKIWDAQTGDCIKTLDQRYGGHKGYIHALIKGDNKNLFISGSGDKTIKIWGNTIV